MSHRLMLRSGVVAALLPILSAALQAAHPVVIDKELVITDLGVVEHADEALKPTGAFHIQTLLEAMAPAGGNAKDVLISFVEGLRTNRIDLPAREIDSRLIDGWKRWKSDDTQLGPSDPLPNDNDWDVNWRKAPFRLLAIVNRMDLRMNPQIGQAGEGRFVFCAVDPANPESGGALPFTIILEYLQPAANQAEIDATAAGWHALGESAAFDAAYIAKLKVVTARFAGRNAMPGRVNGSALGQLRTNDIVLNPAGGPGWELREFVLDSGSHLLAPATAKLTPHHSLDESATLEFLIQTLGTRAFADFPPTLIGFRGITGFNSNFQWALPMGSTIPNTNPTLRMISANSCSGCHGGDGQTSQVEGFYHIAPRSQGVPSTLSKFLTGKPAGGTSVINPATGLADANFSDLDARRRDLSALLGAPELVTPMPLDALDVANLVKEAIEVREARTHRVH